MANSGLMTVWRFCRAGRRLKQTSSEPASSSETSASIDPEATAAAAAEPANTKPVTPADDTDSLREHLESLPQEIYDMIYDLTFTASPGVREITRSYQPPSTLQVDRISRQKYSETYYGHGAIFRISRELDFGGKDHLFSNFVNAFEEQVETLVEHIELPRTKYLMQRLDKRSQDAFVFVTCACTVTLGNVKRGDRMEVERRLRRTRGLAKKVRLVEAEEVEL